MNNWRVPLIGALVLLAGCSGLTGSEETVCAGLSTTGDEYDAATVTVTAPNGTTLAEVETRVADSAYEQCIGLSEADSLDPDTGMLFAYNETAERNFVMRNMSFPLDMVFIDGEGEIVAIYNAPVEDSPRTVYDAEAKFVLEVPRGWAARHNVSVGATVTVEYGDG